MSDGELLELAAKAAGMEYRWEQPRGAAQPIWLRARVPFSGDAFPVWNPLEDDGDAMRLAVRLRMLIEPCRTMGGDFVEVVAYPSGRGDCQGWSKFAGDDLAATRRAIVLAAASLGEQA